jgi:hypothetical protein
MYGFDTATDITCINGGCQKIKQFHSFRLSAKNLAVKSADRNSESRFSP